MRKGKVLKDQYCDKCGRTDRLPQNDSAPDRNTTMKHQMEHIGAMAAQLQILASRAGLSCLAQLLAMAAETARAESSSIETPQILRTPLH
jgi:hypothetical protein